MSNQRLYGWLTSLIHFKAVLWLSLFLSINYSKSRLQLSDSVAYLADVDVVDPDEKSIMTYVAQFLQYSKDVPGTREKAQVCLS